MKFLRQSTVTIVQAGPVLGTDFLTVNTGAALATAHAELFKAGASSAIDISGRTWAHISGGVYALTLTAGDLDTRGPLKVHIHLASTTPFTFDCTVLTPAVYDANFAGANFLADVQAIYTSAAAATQLSSNIRTTLLVTVGNGASTTVVPTDLTNAISNFYVGRSVFFLTGALAGQAATITGYNGTTKQLTISALTGAPAAGDTLVLA